MDFKAAAEALKQKTTAAVKIKAFVGFDGTVDKIISVVDKRTGLGENFQKIKTIAEFGKRITAAAGQSTNMEIFLKKEKEGGNGTIMAEALASAGAQTTLVADLGTPQIHPVFADLQKKAKLVSLGSPTETHALEFDDGKVMLCSTRNHEAITFAWLEKVLGGKSGLTKTIAEADLIALTNWTMIPGMTEIFRKLSAEIFPVIKNGERKKIFFDLADPEKRPANELKEALELIGKFSAHADAILGVNLKEAQQVMAVLNLGKIDESEISVKEGAQKIRGRLNLSCVVIHTVKAARCATEAGAFWVYGPFTPTPKITTGAGDHFNAGFALGMTLGVSPLAALTLGVAFSGYYVRTAENPSFSEAITFIERGW